MERIRQGAEAHEAQQGAGQGWDTSGGLAKQLSGQKSTLRFYKRSLAKGKSAAEPGCVHFRYDFQEKRLTKRLLEIQGDRATQPHIQSDEYNSVAAAHR